MIAGENQAQTCSNVLQAGTFHFDVPPGSLQSRQITARGEVAHCVCRSGSHAFVTKAYLVEIFLAPVKCLEYISGERRVSLAEVQAGTVLTSMANSPVSMRWSSDKESIILAIKPNRMRKQDAAGLETVIVPTAGDMFVLDMARQLKAMMAQPEAVDAPRIDALLTRLIVHLFQSNEAGETRMKPKTGLSLYNAKKVEAFMRENVARKLTVADLARICDLSPSHFISGFTETFGQAPYGYLLSLRLSYAERLLAQTEMPIAEVAYVSGFSSQSHLTATMKKLKGVTPSNIRNRK
ncbi:helix-turn-helix domain-containing protein [Brucella intermedia]|uniref:helix-turn-helix domain-containing protein n=1 Tax=Brucella intermedia TaxID=94625 RepID=UPI00124EFE5A|nr:AraC family transcriptional regulator [Brucella intermedia]